MQSTLVSNAGRSPAFNLSIAFSTDPPAGWESVRLLAVGSKSGVTTVIHTLHRQGVAEVGAWSPLMSTSNPGEVMSVVT